MTEHCDLNHAPIGVFDSGVGGLTVIRRRSLALPVACPIY